MTLGEFLLDRIAEDEQAARDAGAAAMAGEQWKHRGYPEEAYNQLQTLTLNHARRTVAECEAKRRIVEHAETSAERAKVGPAPGDGAWFLTLRYLALPYSDHPDYDETWRP